MRLARFATLTSVAALGLAVSAPAASAADLCIGPAPDGVTCASSYVADGDGLIQAMSASALSAAQDTLHLAAGTYTLPTAISWSANGGDTLQGSGVEQTVITGSATGTLLQIGNSSSPAGISDLTVQTARTGSSDSGTALRLAKDSFGEHLRVVDTSVTTSASTWGVVLSRGARISDVFIQNAGANAYGLSTNDGPVTVTDVELDVAGYAAIQQSFHPSLGTSTFSRIHIRSGATRALTADGGSLHVDDSLIELGGKASATGFVIHNSNNSTYPNELTLTGSTLIGNGTGQRGIFARSDSPGENVTISATDSLLDVRGSNANSWMCQLTDGAMSFTTDHVATTSTSNTGCSPASSATLDLLAAPAIYRDAAAGDYRPTYDSPVVDAGSIPGVKPGADLALQPRAVDGNADGIASTDLGAYEYQRTAPTQPTLSASSTSVAPGTAVSFSAGGSTDAEGEAISYTWDLAGQAASGALASRTFQTPGTYTVTVIATDVAGASGPAASVTITVAAPVTNPTQSATAAAVAITRAPSAKIKRSVKGFSLAPAGTSRTALIALTRTSSLSVSLARLQPGRVKSGACTTTAKRGKRCVVAKPLSGATTLAASGSAIHLAFGGGWNGRRLAAGSYKVTVTPRSAAGVPGAAASFTLTVK